MARGVDSVDLGGDVVPVVGDGLDTPAFTAEDEDAVEAVLVKIDFPTQAIEANGFVSGQDKILLYVRDEGQIAAGGPSTINTLINQSRCQPYTNKSQYKESVNPTQKHKPGIPINAENPRRLIVFLGSSRYMSSK